MIKNNIVSDSSQIYFDFGRAEGSFIWDKNGKKFIDFTSGWNVANLGWNNPEVKEAMLTQLEKSSYVPFWTLDEIQSKLAEELISSLPEVLDTCVRATGGTEANEEAIKIARAYTNRTKIIGFKNSYHGQSEAELAIVYSENIIMGSNPSDFIQIDFPSCNPNKNDEEILEVFEENLENALKNGDVAAIITEAGIVTGGGQTSIAPKGFLEIVRRQSEKYKTLLILDEVGTGFSRCGTLFGLEFENVIPDIITLAKGLSNGGSAIGALVTKKEIIDQTENEAVLISTFGWTLVACAASLKTLQIHKRDKVWKKSKEDGEYILSTLKEKLADSQKVINIRGRGLEIGVLFSDDVDVRKLNQNLFDNGLLVSVDGNNLQLMPPLTIEKEVLDEGLGIFINTING